jgi:dTMP kinase
MSQKGLLISFDGTDSSGKATQTRYLADRLIASGLGIRTFMTPDYNTPSGKELKKRLQNKLGNWKKTPWEEKLGYFAANRTEHREEVREALARGEGVIYDRYVPSSLAFVTIEAQLADSTISRQEVQRVVADKEYGENAMPRENISIFLDVPVDIATRLLEQRKEILRDEDEYTDHVEVQKQLYDEYVRLCRDDPQRFMRVSCTQGGQLLSSEEVHNLVWQQLTQRFPALANLE